MSSELLVLTADTDSESVLPSLALLPHRVRTLGPDSPEIVAATTHDLVVVDARTDLAAARQMCRMVSAGSSAPPVIAVVNEGGLVAVTPDWGVDDIVLPAAGPAEVDARIRLVTTRGAIDSAAGEPLTVGDLVIEEETYTARLKGRALELTYKEFELLKYLAQHAGRVFTRVQLLQEVWGYDFFGGTRTVDVHIRRLRAKLGPEYDAMIGTVRNVGYKFVRPARGAATRSRAQAEQATEAWAPGAAEEAGPGEAGPGEAAASDVTARR